MKFRAVFATVFGAAAASDYVDVPDLIFSNQHVDMSKIPTSYESAVLGRRILALSKLATLSTVFPQPSGTDGADSFETRPSGVDGLPIGLMDYVTDCEDDGNPTIVAIKIATTFKNVKAGSNITLSMRWTPPYPPAKRTSLLSKVASYLPALSFLAETSGSPDPVSYSAANLPRFSLIGYLELIDPDSEYKSYLESCFLEKHEDARYWLPGNKAVHASEWVRLVVQQVYWIGGFGDRAYIGWIPVDEWKNVTREEWQGVELPGEKKDWKEWRMDDGEEL